MQIAAWMQNRETPGTLAHVAKRILESDKTYKATEQTIRSMYVLEALVKHDGNQQRAARAIGVNPQTVRRVLRGLRITGEQVRIVAKHLQGRASIVQSTAE